MKAISYALFGYERQKHENCFSFDSYLAGLMLSIRCNRLVYPDWVNVLETDKSTYNAFEPIFKYLQDKNILRIEKNSDGAKLCEAMLWRMKPVFWETHAFGWEFSHVLCRDLDSLSTYREAQAVKMWVDHDKAVHAMTDSVSHDVPMMGGMIGFRPNHFTFTTDIKTFEQLMKKCTVDLSVKGSDQTFLNGVVYPKVAQKGTDSITQHYFKGHGKTWLSDFHTCNCWIDTCRQGHKEGCPLDVPLDIPVELKETNEISEHMGASGWNQQQTMALINKHKDKFTDLDFIEKEYKSIFYWHR
mgnify:CR=1 FL=1